MQGLWVTVLLVALYSTKATATKAQVDANEKNWTEDKAFCMGRTNRTFYDDVPKFYRLTDDSGNCSTINQGDWTRAKIHNEFENCMAIRKGIKKSIFDFGIDLAKSDCNVSNGFAGNDFSEYFPRNQNKTCVRLRMNESDVVIVDGTIGYNNATWIFYDCNDINSVLCESLVDNTTNTTETPDADNGNFSFPGNCSISDAITDNGSESTGDSNSGSSDGGGGGDDGGDSGSVGGDSASKPAVVETTSVSDETNPPPRTSATRTMTTIPTTATTTTTTAAFAVSPTTVSATSFPASTATAAAETTPISTKPYPPPPKSATRTITTIPATATITAETFTVSPTTVSVTPFSASTATTAVETTSVSTEPNPSPRTSATRARTTIPTAATTTTVPFTVSPTTVAATSVSASTATTAVETISGSTEPNPSPRTSATRAITTIPTAAATTTTTTVAFTVSPTTVSATSFPASTATTAVETTSVSTEPNPPPRSSATRTITTIPATATITAETFTVSPTTVSVTPFSASTATTAVETTSVSTEPNPSPRTSATRAITTIPTAATTTTVPFTVSPTTVAATSVSASTATTAVETTSVSTEITTIPATTTTVAFTALPTTVSATSLPASTAMTADDMAEHTSPTLYTLLTGHKSTTTHVATKTTEKPISLKQQTVTSLPTDTSVATDPTKTTSTSMHTPTTEEIRTESSIPQTTPSFTEPCEPNEEAEAGIGSALGSPTIDEEKLESSLKLIAFAKNVSCKAQYNDTEVRTEIVVSGETTPQIPLDSYRLDGAHFPDGQDSAHKIVMAEFTVDRDVGESYVNDKQIYVDNRRTSFKFPSPGKLFVFTAYGAVTGEAVQTGQLSFSYKLDADDTILDNAKRLTFDTDDANPLGTHHITKQWGVTCAFIDSTSQKFDGSGCSCVMANKTARCTSTHNSVFSVLFTIESVAVPAAVKAMTIVTETISVFFLVLTFVILVRVRRKVRGERIAVQINLVVSLTFLHFWSLLHDVALQSPAFCEAVAVLVHFFLLSSGVWMSVEAFLLYLKTSRWAFIKLKRKKVVIWSMTIGWGLPALICILTAAIGFPLQRYMQVSSLYRDIKEEYNTTRSATVLSSIYKYDMCWLSPDSGIRWAAIAPIILVLVINTAIAGKVAYFVHCKSDEAKNFKPTQQAANKDMVNIQFLNVLRAPLKAVSLLLPILGIPWILMFCSNATNVTARSAFMYVNAIVNGLQGVFVFLVYVVVGKEVRSATVKTLSSLTSSWQSFGDSHELRRKKSDQSDFSTLPKNSVLPIKSTEYTERPRSGGSQQGFV